MITFRGKSWLLCKNFDRISELRNVLICYLFYQHNIVRNMKVVLINISHPPNLKLLLLYEEFSRTKFLDAWAVWYQGLLCQEGGIHEYILWNLEGYFDRLKGPPPLTKLSTICFLPRLISTNTVSKLNKYFFGQIMFVKV